jgi:hypothetical protein
MFREGYTGTGGMAEDRYCRNCGQGLQPKDQFCGNCGRPVHVAAHVPTPEADIPVPPPPQQAEESPQAPQASSGEGRVQTAPWGPVLGMLVVFLALGIGALVQGMPAAPAGKDLAYQLGYQLGAGIGSALAATLAEGAIILVLGVVYYATGRKRSITLREAIFNWPMVVLAAVLIIPSLL